MENAVKKSGDGENESNEGARSTDVKESAGGANRRTEEDKSAEGSDERRERNKKRIAGVNVMVTAGEKVSELMSKKNDEKRGGERQAGEKRRGTLVEKSESAEEFVERDGLILRVGSGELCACGKAGAKSQKKQNESEDEGPAGWTGNGLRIEKFGGRQRAPISGGWKRVDGKF